MQPVPTRRSVELVMKKTVMLAPLRSCTMGPTDVAGAPPTPSLPRTMTVELSIVSVNPSPTSKRLCPPPLLGISTVAVALTM